MGFAVDDLHFGIVPTKKLPHSRKTLTEKRILTNACRTGCDLSLQLNLTPET